MKTPGFYDDAHLHICSICLTLSAKIYYRLLAKFGIPYLPHQYPDIGQNSDGVISDFQLSGQSLIKRNCHKSRTSDHIDMKLGPVTKIDLRNKITSKKIWR